MRHLVGVSAVCFSLAASAAIFSLGASASPSPRQTTSSDLLLKVRVERVFLNRLAGTRRHYVVKARVLEVAQGAFAGSRFDFRVHSPSRAGLRAGAVVLIRAIKTKGGGYLVDETSIRVPRCVSDNECYLRQCCCRWLALQKGAPLPRRCSLRCRCRIPPRPGGVRCAAGKCEAFAAGGAGALASPPKKADRRCRSDSDCVLMRRSACGCPPCNRSDSWAVNRAARERYRAHWSKTRSCPPTECAKCRRKIKAVCRAALCRIGP